MGAGGWDEGCDVCDVCESDAKRGELFALNLGLVNSGQTYSI